MLNIRNLRRTSLLVILTILSSQNHLPAETNSVDALISGEHQFALDLYARLRARTGNLFFSPCSISTCIGAAYVGARGETAAGMAKTLQINLGPDEIGGPMRELRKRLFAHEQDGIELSSANGLWAQKSHRFLPAFVHTVQNDFDATVKQVDFRSHSDDVLREINAWVSGKTKGRITGLLSKDAVEFTTDLVLVNAIYFKGKWQHPFETNKTADATFTTASGPQVQAHFMNGEANFSYAENPVCKLLELPYGDRAPLSMVVLLPNETGMTQLEESFNATNLLAWLQSAQTREVNVSFPKFKMTSELDLSSILRAMGMRDAFSEEADFSGMFGRKFLNISAVIHKAYVDVNEEGTEAAAATGAGFALLGGVHQPDIFRADHPFIFLIRDNATGSILFLGRVNDPTK